MKTQTDESDGSDATITNHDDNNNDNNISATPADNASGTDAAGPYEVGNGSVQGLESVAQPGDDAVLPDASSGAGGDANDGGVSNAVNGSGNDTAMVDITFGKGLTFTKDDPVRAREPSASANAESRPVPNSLADVQRLAFASGPMVANSSFNTADSCGYNAPCRVQFRPYLFIDDEHGHREWINIVFNLRKGWPMAPIDEDANMSGIDVMVTLLRQVYAVAGKTFSLELFTKLSRDNPLLDFAACDLMPELADRDGMLATFAARESLLAQLCVKMDARPSEISFTAIDSHPLVQQTIWAQPRLQGFAETAVRRGDGAREEDVNNVPMLEMLCIWDTTVHDTLYRALCSRELLIQCERGIRTKPMVLRTLFNPTQNPIDGFGIEDIWKVDHPIITAPVTSGGPSKAAMWLEPFRGVASSTFSLVAVVRLRNTADESDYIRLYEPDGRPISPAADVRLYKSFYDGTWSVADQDHKYMLYHTHATDSIGRDVALCGLACEVAPPHPGARAERLRELVERRFRELDERNEQGEVDTGRDVFPYQP